MDFNYVDALFIVALTILTLWFVLKHKAAVKSAFEEPEEEEVEQEEEEQESWRTVWDYIEENQEETVSDIAKKFNLSPLKAYNLAIDWAMHSQKEFEKTFNRP